MNKIESIEWIDTTDGIWFTIYCGKGARVSLMTDDSSGAEVTLSMLDLSSQDLQKLATEAQRGASELKAQEHTRDCHNKN